MRDPEAVETPAQLCDHVAHEAHHADLERRGLAVLEQDAVHAAKLERANRAKLLDEDAMRLADVVDDDVRIRLHRDAVARIGPETPRS